MEACWPSGWRQGRRWRGQQTSRRLGGRLVPPTTTRAATSRRCVTKPAGVTTYDQLSAHTRQKGPKNPGALVRRPQQPERRLPPAKMPSRHRRAVGPRSAAPSPHYVTPCLKARSRKGLQGRGGRRGEERCQLCQRAPARAADCWKLRGAHCVGAAPPLGEAHHSPLGQARQ